MYLKEAVVCGVCLIHCMVIFLLNFSFDTCECFYTMCLVRGTVCEFAGAPFLCGCVEVLL